MAWGADCFLVVELREAWAAQVEGSYVDNFLCACDDAFSSFANEVVQTAQSPGLVLSQDFSRTDQCITRDMEGISLALAVPL